LRGGGRGRDICEYGGKAFLYQVSEKEGGGGRGSCVRVFMNKAGYREG